MMSFQIDMCQRAVTYEPIKELYKGALHLFKQGSKQVVSPMVIDNRGKFMDTIAAFELSKNAYFKVIEAHIDSLFKQLLFLKNKTKEKMTKPRQMELVTLIRQFKSVHCINGDQVPQYLKDVFDLFIETHNSKQFLKKHEQVSD